MIDLEKGRRALTFDELADLAVVLGVSMKALLAADANDGDVVQRRCGVLLGGDIPSLTGDQEVRDNYQQARMLADIGRFQERITRKVCGNSRAESRDRIKVAAAALYGTPMLMMERDTRALAITTAQPMTRVAHAQKVATQSIIAELKAHLEEHQEPSSTKKKRGKA